MNRDPIADEEEFAAFLRDASMPEVYGTAVHMMESVESSMDAITGKEWTRVARTLRRVVEMMPDDAPADARKEVAMAIRVADLFAELDKKLEAMAFEQHGN